MHPNLVEVPFSSQGVVEVPFSSQEVQVHPNLVEVPFSSLEVEVEVVHGVVEVPCFWIGSQEVVEVEVEVEEDMPVQVDSNAC